MRSINLPLWFGLIGIALGLLACAGPAPGFVQDSRSANSAAHADGTVRSHNPEEARVERALRELTLAGHPLLVESSFAKLATANISNDHLLVNARAAGTVLWRRAQSVPETASKTTTGVTPVTQYPPDDRLLYWNRLQQKQLFRAKCAAPADCASALQAFELASRGFNDMTFRNRPKKTHPKQFLRIALTGFDPFGLDKNLLQSNPSGATALALDGKLLSHGTTQAQIQSAMFPVRFADFDEGMVEDLFEPLIQQNRIDLLITVSMGRSNFDLERFPGRRRSATATDNLQVLTGASKTNPVVPALRGEPLAGSEFVEFSLPAASMQNAEGPYLINDNRNVQTLAKPPFAAPSLAALSGATAVSGSGGGYLSNEISYRTVRLVQSLGSEIVVGHIHTPRINNYDTDAISAIRRQIEQMLIAAISVH